MPMFRPYLYLAYGSNLCLRQFSMRCPAAEPVTACNLPGFRLVFRGVADLVPDPKGMAKGALYRITWACERELDRYEGYPRLYRKEFFTAQIPGGEVHELMYYAMNSKRKAPPGSFYLETILEGYRDWGLDTQPLLEAAGQHKMRLRSLDATAEEDEEMDRKALLRRLMEEARLTRARTAEVLHVSVDTVHSWLKPPSSRSSNPVPLWAIELLALKRQLELPLGWDAPPAQSEPSPEAQGDEALAG